MQGELSRCALRIELKLTATGNIVLNYEDRVENYATWIWICGARPYTGCASDILDNNNNLATI